LRAAIELALRERKRWPEIGRLARESSAVFGLPQVIDQYLALCSDLGFGNRERSGADIVDAG